MHEPFESILLKTDLFECARTVRIFEFEVVGAQSSSEQPLGHRHQRLDTTQRQAGPEGRRPRLWPGWTCSRSGERQGSHHAAATEPPPPPRGSKNKNLRRVREPNDAVRGRRMGRSQHAGGGLSRDRCRRTCAATARPLDCTTPPKLASALAAAAAAACGAWRLLGPKAPDWKGPIARGATARALPQLEIPLGRTTHQKKCRSLEKPRSGVHRRANLALRTLYPKPYALQLPSGEGPGPWAPHV